MRTYKSGKVGKFKNTKVLATCILSLLIATIALAQELREMHWEEVPTRVIPDGSYSEKSLLIIESTIPKLSFESTRGIAPGSVKEKEPGIWWVTLKPGVQLISISSEGFLLLKNIRHNFGKRQSWQIKITPIVVLGALSGFDENRAEIRLNYQPSSPDEAVYGGLDDMVMKIDFSRGYAVFNPAPGAHKIKLNAGGRIWEKSYDLMAKEKIEEQISFAGGKQEQLDIKDPGNLFITSEPNGATVYLNKVEQGVTPLTKDDVQPGTYQVEVVRELYLPESKVIKVESNSYAKENFELTPNFGRLSISSNPSGAMLWINDKNVGRTPYDVGQYNAGTYSLRMIHEMYYETTDTFKIEPGGDFIQTYSLKPQFGGIRINSEPTGAQLSIDGQPAGTTPVSRDQLASGKHIIRLTKENYFDSETTIEIADGQNFSETYQLKSNFGLLSVVSSPSGAAVVIAGENRRLGETPLRDVKLPAGTYTIKVEKDLYESYEMPVSLMIGGERKLEPKLKRKTGKLRVKSEPPMADIYLNGERKGQTPTIINDLPTDDYDIRLQKSGYDIQLGKVRIEHNEMAEYSMTLGSKGTVEWKKRRTQARVLSFIPSAGQFSSGQYVKGSFYAGAFLGSVAMVFLASQDYSSAESDYNSAMSDYKSVEDQVTIDLFRSKVESSFDDMQSASDKAMMFMVAAGGVYALQFIDAWIWGGGKRPISGEHSYMGQIDPYVLAENHIPKVGLRITWGGK